MLIRSVLFNFQGAFLNFVFLISQTTLLLYHIFSSLSRGFLNFFKVFFKPSWFFRKKRLPFRKLLYYITLSLVCQEVFKTFFKVFCDLFAFAVPSSRVLVYYITFTGKSQHFFEKFFFIRYLCPIYLTLFQQYTAICTVARPFLHSFTYFTRAFSQTTNSFLYIFTQILVNL